MRGISSCQINGAVTFYLEPYFISFSRKLSHVNLFFLPEGYFPQAYFVTQMVQ